MVVPVAGMGPARGIGDVGLAFVTTRLPPLLGFGQSKQTLLYITIKSSPQMILSKCNHGVVVTKETRDASLPFITPDQSNNHQIHISAFYRSPDKSASNKVWEVPKRELVPFYFICSTGKTSTSPSPNF